MPFCKEGNLEERKNLYKDVLEQVLLVGKKLAETISYAHEQGVKHRDIKPQNILFKCKDNNPIISDFGIALVSEYDRATETGEIVGPKSFMAPELEDGGVLAVSNSADIYSLGKVLYFMFSGGVVLPRERHREEKYNIFSAHGYRGQQFGVLLDRMICSIDDRFQDMSEVLDKIEKILSWEKSGPSAKFLEKFSKTLENEQKNRSIENRNIEIIEKMNASFSQYQETLVDWIKKILEQYREIIKNEDFFECEISDTKIESNLNAGQVGLPRNYLIHLGVSLGIRSKSQRRKTVYRLTFLLCEPRTLRFKSGMVYKFNYIVMF